MIIGRSFSGEEVTERTRSWIEMLTPENAAAVFQETAAYAATRIVEVKENSIFRDIHAETYDAYLNAIMPWLMEQGFPDCVRRFCNARPCKGKHPNDDARF